VRVRAEIHYAADPATVFAMLTDKTFQERKLERTGALSWEVRIAEEPGAGVAVTSSRAMPTDQVPDAFRAMIGPRLTIGQTETWAAAGPDGARTGRLEVAVDGAPIKLTGTLSLTPSGAGTLEVVDGDLNARIPFVGGRVEKAAEPAIRAAIDAEERIGHAWLAER
jgi:hypothetical protein